ncbi:MAG: hypothetical protein Q4B29_02880 [Candidatus Saccharibacteria bacterium]|nr:hypothetical protein [Candidatus Saccharibacteria bacterium]
MERLSKIIQPIYQKFLPEAKKKNICFNLDFPDTTLKVANACDLEKKLSKILKVAFKRSTNESVSIFVHPGKVTIKDTGILLDNVTRENFKKDNLEVKSRIGFGTEITIKF